MSLHQHETASIGARGAALTGQGAEYARLVWLVILSHTKWPGRAEGPTWASNATVARESGLELNDVELALGKLRRAGLLTTPIGKRPGARRPCGRLLVPTLGARCKLLIPESFDVGNLWTLARSCRRRAASLVTAMVGAYALACDHAGDRIEDWSELGCKQADWRRFVGAKKNASWAKRIRELVELGLLRREGRRVFVAPPRAWFALAVRVAEKRRGIGQVVPMSPRRAERPSLPQPPRLLRAQLEVPPPIVVFDPAVWEPVELGCTGTDDALVELDRGPPALHVLRPP